MEPVGKRGYVPSKIENLNMANHLLAEAQDAYEKPDATIDDLDFLQEAYEKAQRGYDMLSSINPDAASTITIHKEIQKKIWKIQKPPKSKEKIKPPAEKEGLTQEKLVAKPKKKTPRGQKNA